MIRKAIRNKDELFKISNSFLDSNYVNTMITNDNFNTICTDQESKFLKRKMRIIYVQTFNKTHSNNIYPDSLIIFSGFGRFPIIGSYRRIGVDMRQIKRDSLISPMNNVNLDSLFKEQDQEKFYKISEGMYYFDEKWYLE